MHDLKRFGPFRGAPGPCPLAAGSRPCLRAAHALITSNSAHLRLRCLRWQVSASITLVVYFLDAVFGDLCTEERLAGMMLHCRVSSTGCLDGETEGWFWAWGHCAALDARVAASVRRQARGRCRSGVVPPTLELDGEEGGGRRWARGHVLRLQYIRAPHAVKGQQRRP